MRKFRLLSIFCALLSVVFFASCTDTPETPVDSVTKVTLEQTVVDVVAEGGVFSVDYTVENPLPGIDVVGKTSVEWITSIVAEGGVLKFSVAANGQPEERSAFINVKYPNVDDVRLEVRQAGFEGVTFQMEISNKTTTTCTSKVVPSDSEVPYIIYMAELDYFYNMGITTAEELFIDDYNYFMGMAEQYNVEMLEEFLLMNQIAFKGESVISWTNMTPDKEYVLYAYAIDVNDENNDYTLGSPIAHMMFSLSSSELSEVKFDVQIEVDGPEATYTIKPIDYNGKYYLDIYAEGDYMYRSPGTELDDSYVRTVTNTWMSMISIYMQSGYSAEQLFEIMCLEGEETYSEVRDAATNYAMVLYAIEMVDGLPQVASKPQLVNFSTEAVEMSDMTIDIKVENNYVRVADVSVTPSTEEPYTVALVATEEVPDSTDGEIMSWLITNFDMSLYRGSIFSHVNTLQPETAYTVFAFGYYGGTITTELFRVDFMTEAAGECQNSVVGVEWNGPYSLAELEAYDSSKYYNYGMFEAMGWFAMWAEIETAEPSQDMFFTIYRAETIAFEEEQTIVNDLVSSGVASPRIKLLTGESGVLYQLCAVVMDYKGNYSELWRSEPFMYEYNADTKRSLDELTSKLAEPSEPAPARQSVKLL